MSNSPAERAGRISRLIISAVVAVAAVLIPVIGLAGTTATEACRGKPTIAGKLLEPFQAIVRLPDLGRACLRAVPGKRILSSGTSSVRFVIFARDRILSIPRAPAYLWDSAVQIVCAAGVFTDKKSGKTILVINGETGTRRGLYFDTIIYRYHSVKFYLDTEGSLANVSESCNPSKIARIYFSKIK